MILLVVTSCGHGPNGQGVITRMHRDIFTDQVIVYVKFDHYRTVRFIGSDTCKIGQIVKLR